MLATEPRPQVVAAPLEAHALTRGGPVHTVVAQVCRMPRGMLTVTYTIEGAIDRVCVPIARAPRRVDALWQHTCCELFVRREGSASYHEFNFAPSGEWAAYEFESYRQGRAPLNEGLNPNVTALGGRYNLIVTAAVPLERLSADHVRSALDIAISTVIEAEDGSLSYWALAHPAGKPDFHHADAFVLKLDAIRD